MPALLHHRQQRHADSGAGFDVRRGWALQFPGDRIRRRRHKARGHCRGQEQVPHYWLAAVGGGAPAGAPRSTYPACSTCLVLSSCTKTTTARLARSIWSFLALNLNVSPRWPLASYSSSCFRMSLLMASSSKLASKVPLPLASTA